MPMSQLAGVPFRGGGGGCTRPWCWFGCLRRRIAASRPCTVRPSVGPNVVWSSVDLSCVTTPGVGRPRDGAVARAANQGHPDAHSESMPKGGGGVAPDLEILRQHTTTARAPCPTHGKVLNQHKGTHFIPPKRLCGTLSANAPGERGAAQRTCSRTWANAQEEL